MNINKTDDVSELQAKMIQYESEIRKLKREITHLKHAIAQEKTAYTTVLNQQKASTFIQRERERYLSLLLANSPSIILFLNQAMRVEFCTEYFITKAGFKNESEVLGHTLTEVLASFQDADSHEKLLAHSKKVIQINAPVSYDTTFCFKSGGGSGDDSNDNGTKEDFAGILVPMRDAKHESNGIMLMFHDITDIKRSREEALAASRAKSSFLSNMSHEIRTPMNAIIGMAQIARSSDDSGKIIDCIHKIESASTHLLGVINDILDISKIESGKMELSPVVFSFSQMLDRVKSVVTVKMHDKMQKFSVEIDPAIPDILFGDEQRLSQVITNLLSNAAKFTPEGGSIIFNAALLNSQKNKCYIQIYVKDSGIGISKQEQEKLFHAFQQAEAGISRKYGGSGLGLVICKRILELMDGDIWVESEPGKGSCFTFQVSLGIPNHIDSATDFVQEIALKSFKLNKKDEENEEDKKDKKEEYSEDFSGNIILIADDVDINLDIAAALLEPTNIKIDTVKGGREAFEAFAANPERYDLILMDMQMPETDGLQATRMIRELNTPEALNIPIIAMTANVFKEDIQKCIDSGMNNHLSKPIIINDVMKMLSRYLKKPDKII